MYQLSIEQNQKKGKKLTITDPVYSGAEFRGLWDYVLRHGSNFDKFFEGLDHPRERLLDENEWFDIHTALRLWENYRKCLPNYDMTENDPIMFYAASVSSYGIAKLVAQFTSIKTNYRILPFLVSAVSKIDLLKVLELKKDSAVIEYKPYPGFKKFIDSSFVFSFLGILKAFPVVHDMPPASARESASLINVFNKFAIDFAQFHHKIEERDKIIYLDNRPAGRWIKISEGLNIHPAVCRHLSGEKCILWEKDVIEKTKSGRKAVVARKGDLYNCSKTIFTVTWKNPSLPEAVQNLIATLKQSLFAFFKSRASLLKQTSLLRNQASILQDRINEKKRDLLSAHQKIARMEKRSIEHTITGGFAHEMRNALTGVQLALKSIEKHNSYPGKFDKNIASFKINLEKTIGEYHIPEHQTRHNFKLLGQIKERQSHLSSAFKKVSKDIDRGLAITRRIRGYAEIHDFTAGGALIDLYAFMESYQLKYREIFKGLRIDYSVTGSKGHMLKANHEHLDAIFSNLILNAQQALMKKKEKRRIDVDLTIDAPYIKISVKDNGSGIEGRHKKEIFKPFFSTKPNNGTGLGLSIVQRLIELYGGTINFTTETNQGTIFEIGFPMN